MSAILTTLAELAIIYGAAAVLDNQVLCHKFDIVGNGQISESNRGCLKVPANLINDENYLVFINRKAVAGFYDKADAVKFAKDPEVNGEIHQLKLRKEHWRFC